MKRAILSLGPLFFLCGLAFGQFGAADVHISPPDTTESGGFLPHGRMEFRGTTLLKLIGVAYSVRTDRIAGGPSWLDTDRFDVVAKAASSASEIAMRNMLKTLLAERFGLSIHEEESQCRSSPWCW
jgi:uncharacterized protein (TIGR03435 family)